MKIPKFQKSTKFNSGFTMDFYNIQRQIQIFKNRDTILGGHYSRGGGIVFGNTVFEAIVVS